MQQYTDFEKRHAELRNKQKELDLETIRCPKCNSQWFEQIKVSRFKADHHIILGQDIPIRPGSVPYTLLKCIVCNDILEPRIQHNSRDTAFGGYDHFLDTLEGKFDNRPKEEEEEADALQTQEL